MSAPDRAGAGGGPRRGRGAGRRAGGGEPGGPPERVGGLVGAVLARLGIVDRVARAGAAADWEAIVGPHIARVTGRRRVRGRTLFVEVRSAAWLTELNMMRRDLLRKLNEGRQGARIERIVFVQGGGEEGPSEARKGRRREASGRGSADGRGGTDRAEEG